MSQKLIQKTQIQKTWKATFLDTFKDNKVSCFVFLQSWKTVFRIAASKGVERTSTLNPIKTVNPLSRCAITIPRAHIAHYAFIPTVYGIRHYTVSATHLASYRERTLCSSFMFCFRSSHNLLTCWE